MRSNLFLRKRNSGWVCHGQAQRNKRRKADENSLQQVRLCRAASERQPRDAQQGKHMRHHPAEGNTRRTSQQDPEGLRHRQGRIRKNYVRTASLIFYTSSFSSSLLTFGRLSLTGLEAGTPIITAFFILPSFFSRSRFHMRSKP